MDISRWCNHRVGAITTHAPWWGAGTPSGGSTGSTEAFGHEVWTFTGTEARVPVARSEDRHKTCAARPGLRPCPGGTKRGWIGGAGSNPGEFPGTASPCRHWFTGSMRLLLLASVKIALNRPVFYRFEKNLPE